MLIDQYKLVITVTETFWGEPEQVSHSHVLKMSFCAMLKVCLLLAPVVCTGQLLCGRASCCNVKVMSLSLTKTTSFLGIDIASMLITSRSWVRASHGHFSFFFCATETIMGATGLLHEYTYLLWINNQDYEYWIEWVRHSVVGRA